MASLLASGDDTDVEIYVAHRTFHAHSPILSARSPYLKGMLASSMREAETKEIKETEMDPDTFEVLLRFMYTDLVDDDAVQANGEDLLRGANFYVLHGLKMRCEVALCKELTVENVASRLLLADQTEADMLKEACLEFIKPNVGAVIASPGWACIPAHNGGLLLQEVMAATAGVQVGVAGQ